jgi:hypothetical protein
MGVGPFSSSSESVQRLTDRSVQASDQALVYQPQSSGNTRTSNRLGAGASLTINQGVSPEQFESFARSLSAAGQTNPNSADDRAFKEAILLSLEQRTVANTERATDEATAAAPSNVRQYVVWAVVVVVGIALAVLFGGRKKA